MVRRRRAHPGPRPGRKGYGYVYPRPGTTMADQPQRGRPTKLTPEKHAAIIAAIRAGASRQAAAASVGIAYNTLCEWLARGEGRDPDRTAESDFASFANDLRTAEAEFEQSLIQQVMSYSAMGDKPDWRGPAWLLERRFSQQWGKTTKTELSGPGGEPLSKIDVAKLSDAELAELRQRLRGGKP